MRGNVNSAEDYLLKWRDFSPAESAEEKDGL
jgi:hypothetical protein